MWIEKTTRKYKRTEQKKLLKKKNENEISYWFCPRYLKCSWWRLTVQASRRERGGIKLAKDGEYKKGGAFFFYIGGACPFPTSRSDLIPKSDGTDWSCTGLRWCGNKIIQKITVWSWRVRASGSPVHWASQRLVLSSGTWESDSDRRGARGRVRPPRWRGKQGQLESTTTVIFWNGDTRLVLFFFFYWAIMVLIY